MSTAASLSLRPSTEADIPLLFQIYASTREMEMAMVPWTDEQKHGFLVMQFQCQHTDYHQNYPECAFDIVEVDGQPVGRLYLDRRADEFRIVDIAILSPYRGAGIGTQLLSDVIGQASAAGKPVTIHVERVNPALRLYQRLGFVEIGANEIYLLMERKPDTSPH